MTDIAIEYDANTQTFDARIDGADLASESGIRAAVLVSLFTDRRAQSDDVLPDGTDDRRGCWFDAWSDIEGDQFGSRLWLLSRAKQTPDVLPRAQQYAEEALAWLIEDGVARSVHVLADWITRGTLGVQVTIQLTDGSVFYDVFNYPVEGQ